MGERSGPPWFKYPRALARAFAQAPIPGRHHRVLHALADLTWGWGKDSDQLSSGQIAEAAGLSPGQTREALRDLVAWGMVRRETGGPRVASTWGIEQDPEAWEIGQTEAGRRRSAREAKVPEAQEAEGKAPSSGRRTGRQGAEGNAVQGAEGQAEIGAEGQAPPIEKRESAPSLRSGASPPAAPPDPSPAPTAEAKVLELVPPTDPGEPIQGMLIEEPSMAERLVDFFTERRQTAIPHVQPPTPAARKTWLLEMDRLVRIGSPGQRTGDPPTVREIAETIFWLFDVREPTDSALFWRKVIESVPKFRVQYHDRLRTEILAEQEARGRADTRRTRSEAGTLREGADLVRGLLEIRGRKS